MHRKLVVKRFNLLSAVSFFYPIAERRLITAEALTALVQQLLTYRPGLKRYNRAGSSFSAFPLSHKMQYRATFASDPSLSPVDVQFCFVSMSRAIVCVSPYRTTRLGLQ